MDTSTGHRGYLTSVPATLTILSGLCQFHAIVPLLLVFSTAHCGLSLFRVVDRCHSRMRSLVLLTYLTSLYLQFTFLISHPPSHHLQPSLIFLFLTTIAMTFNTAALYGYPQAIPSSYQVRYEPLPPRRPRAYTKTQDAQARWHHDVQQMPGFHTTSNFQPPILNREHSSMWDDVEVQNDWTMAAREQGLVCQLQIERSPHYEQHTRKNKKHKRVSFDTERGCCASIDRKRTRHESESRGRVSVDRKRARHESVDHERRGRVSLDRPQDHPAFIEHEPELRASVDRERQWRKSVDRERERRTSIDRRHERDMPIGCRGQYGSVSRMFPRPPVCAVSLKPPTTGPRSRSRKSESEFVTVPRAQMCAVSFQPPNTGSQSCHRKSDSDSVAFPRPPVCAVSFKPPTTGPKSCHRNSDSDPVAFHRPSLYAVSSKFSITNSQSRHPRRSSFDCATGHDYSGERQHSAYNLPPIAPAPQIHLPPRQRDRTASVEAVHRLPFLSPEVLPLEKSKPSGLIRFNPFNRLRSATMFTSQKIRHKAAGRA